MPRLTVSKCYFGCQLNGGPIHQFPRWEYPNTDRFNKWKSVLKTETQNRGNDYIYNNVRLCGKHFENYFRVRCRRLTGNAIPTLNLYYKCRSQSPVILDKEAELQSNATSATPGYILQIKRKEQKGEIDRNLYVPEVVDEMSPESDSDFMQIEPSKTNIEEEDVQKDLISCFEHVATTGLSEHDRKDLADKHLVHGNCMLFGAPTLNPDVKAALSQMAIERDQAIEYKQALLASAIAGLVEAIAVVVSSEDNKANLLRLLVDIGRLLCECQYNDTMTRRKCILNAVNKDMKEKLKNTKINTYLFGESISLQHNLKTAESIYKPGAELTMEPRPKTAQTIHKSVAAITMSLNPITVAAIHKSGAEITPTLRLKPVELLRKSGAKIIQAQTPNTAEAIHKSGEDISLATRLKMVKAIRKSDAIHKPGSDNTKKSQKHVIPNTPNQKSAEVIHKSGAITLTRRPITAEFIHKSGSDITMTPTQHTAEAIHNSGEDISLALTLKKVEVIHESGTEVTMAPNLYEINMPKKPKYSDSCDYEKKKVTVIERDERLKLNSPKLSPSWQSPSNER